MHRRTASFLAAVICQLIATVAYAQLPTMRITTADGQDVVTKAWRGARIDWAEAQGQTEGHCEGVQIRARGNSTFRHPKKPFALHTTEPTAFYGMEQASDWLLIANFMDHSLLRNAMALSIARQTSLPATSTYRNVAVYMNDEYRGVYLLCGGVDVAPGRVEIPDGGWLVEADSYEDSVGFFRSPVRQLPLHVRYPAGGDPRVMVRAADVMARVEQSLYGGGDEWLQLLHLDSFADWWILHELTMNAEPNGPRSCYMLYDGKRLMAGPAWDFDLAFNPVGLDSGGDIRPFRLHRKDVVELTADSSFCSKALWYDALLTKDVFRSHLAKRWAAIRGACLETVAQIDQTAQQMKLEAEKDQARWGALDPAKFDTSTSWQEAYDRLHATILQRIKWMDNLVKKDE